MAKLRHGQTFLYDDNDDIIGIRDIDGSEFLFARKPDLGVFMDLGNQTDGSGAVAMEFDTAVIERGVTLVDGNKIRVSRAGLYNFQVSVHLHNADSQAHFFELWGRRNTADIANSRFIYTVPSSHGGEPGTLIPSQNFWLQLEAGDQVQILWATDDADVTIAYHAVEVGPPAKPAAPSLLLTVNRIDD
jgi:hypothetical protein